MPYTDPTATDVSRLAQLTAADATGALLWAAASDWRYRRAYRVASTADPAIPDASDVVGVTYWADRNQRWLPLAVYAGLVRPAREVLEDATLTPISTVRAVTTGVTLLAAAVGVAALRVLRRDGGDRL